MEIIHDTQNKTFKTAVDGHTAYVSYRAEDGEFDIRHTIVPKEIGGRGIAAQLVKSACDYARQRHLRLIATCSYAAGWLQKHPEYGGQTGKDYSGQGTCAL